MVHGGRVIVAPELMLIAAVEPENTITFESRTWMPFCALQAMADEPGATLWSHNAPLYWPSPLEVAPTKLFGDKPLVVPT